MERRFNPLDPLGLFERSPGSANPGRAAEIQRILGGTAEQLLDARDAAHRAYERLDRMLDIPQAEWPAILRGFSLQAEFARIGGVLDNLESSIRILREKEAEVQTGKAISQSEREAIRVRTMKVRPRRR